MRKRKMSNVRTTATSTSSARTTKKTITKCEWSHICPCVGKCRVSGVFTRFGTNQCACRDYFKPQFLEGFLKHGQSRSNRRRLECQRGD